MDWLRGLKRAWAFILGLVWVLSLLLGGMSGLESFGQAFLGALVFTLIWYLLGLALLWVIKGFMRDGGAK